MRTLQPIASLYAAANLSRSSKPRGSAVALAHRRGMGYAMHRVNAVRGKGNPGNAVHGKGDSSKRGTRYWHLSQTRYAVCQKGSNPASQPASQPAIAFQLIPLGHIDAVARYTQCPQSGNTIDRCASTGSADGESLKNAVVRYSAEGNAVRRYAVHRITCRTRRKQPGSSFATGLMLSECAATMWSTSCFSRRLSVPAFAVDSQNQGWQRTVFTEHDNMFRYPQEAFTLSEEMFRYQVPGTCLVPGTRYRHKVPGTSYQVPGTK